MTVVSEMLLSGVSGSAAADASAIGSMTIPSMVRSGYRPEFAAGLTAAASTMGPIIPPSILMVIYGSVTGISVGALFLGGMIPGILMGVALMGMVYYYARRHRYQAAGARAPLSLVWQRFKEAVWALMTGVIVLGMGLFGLIFARPTYTIKAHALQGELQAPLVDRLQHRGELLFRGGRMNVPGGTGGEGEDGRGEGGSAKQRCATRRGQFPTRSCWICQRPLDFTITRVLVLLALVTSDL